MFMGAVLLMSRILVFVEGQTELTFVREVVAPYLGQFGLSVNSTLAGKPGSGGVPPFPRFLDEVVALLRKDSNTICTTMFDFYGMPLSWPQRREARSISFEQKPLIIENAVAEAVSQQLGDSFRRERFVPYVQMHEFEALLFSDPETLGEAMLEPYSVQALQEIANEFEHPELINDHVHSTPSKRLLQINPAYQKIFHGNLAAKRIGLQQMRERCPHFNYWISNLEQCGVGEKP